MHCLFVNALLFNGAFLPLSFLLSWIGLRNSRRRTLFLSSNFNCLTFESRASFEGESCKCKACFHLLPYKQDAEYQQKVTYIITLIWLPPCVTVEAYYFPRRQLIFSFGRRAIYLFKRLWEYIPKSIPSFCLSVCTSIFKRITGLHFILNLWCYSSNSSRLPLQSNGKIF